MADMTIRGNFDIAALNNLVTDLGTVQQGITATTGEPYLRMGRDGKWIFGAENIEVEPGSLWAISPLSVYHGYVCWSKDDGSSKSNQKLGEVMVPSGQPKPALHTLPDHGYPWSEQVSLALACISGSDEGTQVKYSVASAGGMNEVKALLGTMVKRIAAEQQNGGIKPSSAIVPIVELDHSHYIHQKYGKIYTPLMPVVRWGTLDGSDEPKPTKPTPVKQAAAPVEDDGIPFEGGTVAAEKPRTRQRQRA
jgi:hypothetical protein